jgi:predicted  nucleic acid-binding Zn-ribbon protein
VFTIENNNETIAYYRQQKESKISVIYFYGNGCQGCDMVNIFHQFEKKGINTNMYIVEYPGYGTRSNRTSWRILDCCGTS